MSGVNEPTYHHVGTGRTRSDYWCRTCNGWYGVPHNDFDHSTDRRHAESCCCGTCLTDDRRRSEGVVLAHTDYLDLWERADPDERWRAFRLGAGE